MAAIAATDVTYTIVNQARMGSAGYRTVVTIAFGDGALTYPTGGVPLTKGKMGAPNYIDTVQLLEGSYSATAYQPFWDKANNKLKLMGTGAAQYAVQNEVQAVTAPAALSFTAEVIGW